MTAILWETVSKVYFKFQISIHLSFLLYNSFRNSCLPTSIWPQLLFLLGTTPVRTVKNEVSDQDHLGIKMSQGLRLQRVSKIVCRVPKNTFRSNQFWYAWEKVRSVKVSSLGKRSELRIYFPVDCQVFFFAYRSPTLSPIFLKASVVNMERGMKTL